MPPRNASGVTVTFEPLPRPKRQLRFPDRRRSTRHRASTPRLRKEQSTLTQLEFINIPSSGREDISSDEDFEEPRPKKKRRKSKFDVRENDQSSLTQVVGRPSLRKMDVDEDDFRVWKDDSEAENVPEIPETSQVDACSSPRRNEVASILAAEPKPALQTPSRRRLKEVPSSQTPPSTKFSRHSSRRKSAVQQSPLKERSTNIRPAAENDWSPGSRKISSKKLEQSPGTTRKIPLNDLPARSPVWKRDASQAFAANERSPNPNTRQRKLRRVNTVQDSQPEDLELATTILVAESPVKPAPNLKRSTTVQDSQYEDFTLLSDPLEEDGPLLDQSSEAEDLQTYGGYTQATYDPVSAALDRDAARYRWTQTQAHAPPRDDRQDEESETDDEDLDRGCYLRTTSHIASVPQRSPETSNIKEEHPDDVAVEACSEPRLNDLGKHALPEEDTIDEPGGITLVPDEALPSSPPVLDPIIDNALCEKTGKAIPSSLPAPHPSQISTVVPTQSGVQQVSTYDEFDAEPPPNTMPPGLPTMAALEFSSQQSSSCFQNRYTCSSLPLPPWSSQPEVQEAEVATHCDSQVQDWSLPVPPPMSSSRTETPASSSR